MPHRAAAFAFLFLTLGHLSQPAAAATPCVEYGDYVRNVGWAPLPETSGRMASDDGLAYVCRGTTGLMIVDVTVPSEPTPILTYDTPGSCSDVVAEGRIVYVADGNSGLLVLDVSNPASPQVLTTYVAGSAVSYIGRDGNRLGVLGANVFRLLDVSDPASPLPMGTLPVTASFDVEVRGNRAYLGGQGSMKILDLTNPATPTLAGTFTVFGAAFNLDVMGIHVLVANAGSGLDTSDNWLVDCSNPASPTATWNESIYGAAYDVAVDGNLGYVFGYQNWFEVWDFTTPATPTLVMRHSCASIGPLALADGLLLINEVDRLQVYNVDPFEFPPVVATLSDLPVWGTRMATTPGRVYTFGRTGGQAVLGIVDAGVPGAPIWKSSIQVASSANAVGIQAVGNRVYVHTRRYFSSGQSHLAIVDVTNALAPNILGTLPTLGGGSLAVVGNYAYVAQNGASIAVVDISTPSSPVLVSETPSAGVGLGVDYDNGYLYLATESEGLQIFDLSVPASPTFVGSFPLPYANEVTVRDQVAYVSGGDVFMIDVSNPAVLSLLSTLVVDGFAGPIRFDGAYAWITTDVDVIVVDMSNPAAPRRLGEQAGHGYVYDDVGVVDDLVYTCGSDGTIQVLPAQCTVTAVPEGPTGPIAAGLRVLPPFPNPTTDDVAFVARLPGAGPYETAIHDIGGRLVTNLTSIDAPGPMDASLTWNGRDQHGRSVATGVYFIRVNGRGETATQRILVTK